jgi:hypothetical protein
MESTSDFSQRLNTNYVPSDRELLVLKCWIEDREALAAILAAKMEETKSSGNALVEMEEELAAHRQFIVDHRMLTSPTYSTHPARRPLPHLPNMPRAEIDRFPALPLFRENQPCVRRLAPTGA